MRDLSTRLGSSVNSVPVRGEVDLRDGDTIKLGVNFVRFNLRQRRANANHGSTQPQTQAVPSAPLPPPPTRQTAQTHRTSTPEKVSSPTLPIADSSTAGSSGAKTLVKSKTAGDQVSRSVPPPPPKPVPAPPAASAPKPVPAPPTAPREPLSYGAKPTGFKLPPPPPTKKN